MFPREGKFRVGTATAIALVAVFAVAMAAPAEAAGWGSWSEAWGLEGEFLARALAWLGLAPDSGVGLKCYDGSHIDPDGQCRKARSDAALKCDDGASIDPNGNCHKAEREHRLRVETSGTVPASIRFTSAWRP